MSAVPQQQQPPQQAPAAPAYFVDTKKGEVSELKQVRELTAILIIRRKRYQSSPSFFCFFLSSVVEKHLRRA